MWLLHSLVDGFSVPVHDADVQLYRMLIAIAVLLKTAATLFLGDWNRLRSGSFGRYQIERRRGAELAAIISMLHKPLILIRFAAALLLLVGIQSRLAIAVIILGLVEELSYEYRFNTIYMTLCLCFLLPAQQLGFGFKLSDSVSTANSWSQFLIVLL